VFPFGNGYGTTSHDAVRMKCQVCHSCGTNMVLHCCT